MQEFEEVANGNLSDYSYQTEEPDEILEDIRESLREGFAEVLALGKVLIDRLRYPMLSNDMSQETIEPQIAISEFEGILHEIRARQLDIDQIVQSFHQGDEHYNVFDEVDSGNRRYVVNETPVMLEVQVFEEQMPVEALQKDLEIEKRIEEVSLKLFKKRRALFEEMRDRSRDRADLCFNISQLYENCPLCKLLGFIGVEWVELI